MQTNKKVVKDLKDYLHCYSLVMMNSGCISKLL